MMYDDNYFHFLSCFISISFYFHYIQIKDQTIKDQTIKDQPRKSNQKQEIKPLRSVLYVQKTMDGYQYQ